MEGKLIKNHYGFEYLLMDEKGETIATLESGKLSLKNCQAIENGYDLDELAKEASDGLIENHIWAISMTFFKAGFQKALEILGDKKFSEDDMHEAIRKAKSYDEIPNHEGVIVRFNYLKEEIIQSLQQTEWDVEIEMECVMGCQNLILNGENSVCCGDKKPKLDVESCLILKRK